MAKDANEKLILPEPTPNKHPAYLDRIGHALDPKRVKEETKKVCEVGEQHMLIVDGKPAYYTVEPPSGKPTMLMDVYRGMVFSTEDEFKQHVNACHKAGGVPPRLAHWRPSVEKRVHHPFGFPVEYELRGGLEAVEV